MSIKSIMKLTAIGFFALFFGVSAAQAQQPNTSLCDYLSGQAKGLCKAGVAAGCNDGTGNAMACTNIEDMLADIGVTPPWQWPPCPCDYSAIPQTLNGPWDTTADRGITLGCAGQFGNPTIHTSVLTDNLRTTGVGTNIGVGNFIEEGTGPFCTVYDEPTNTDIKIFLQNDDERESCALAVQNYTRQMEALFPGVIDTTGCLEY